MFKRKEILWKWQSFTFLLVAFHITNKKDGIKRFKVNQTILNVDKAKNLLCISNAKKDIPKRIS